MVTEGTPELNAQLLRRSEFAPDGFRSGFHPVVGLGHYAELRRGLGIADAEKINLDAEKVEVVVGDAIEPVECGAVLFSELAGDLKIKALTNRWSATTFAVVTAAILAFATGADGKGAMKLWPLFGSSNQLLATLALLVVTLYLKGKGGFKFLVTAVPCIVMAVITCWAMVKNEMVFIAERNWLLIIIGSGIFILAWWMIIEAVIVFFRERRPREQMLV